MNQPHISAFILGFNAVVMLIITLIFWNRKLPPGIFWSAIIFTVLSASLFVWSAR